MSDSRRRRWLVIGIAVLGIAVYATLNRVFLAGWIDQNGVVLRQAIVTGLLIGGVFGLVAMGLTLIFGVLDIINFAHGALLTIGMYAAFVLFDRFGVDPYLAILITVPLLFIIGILIQRTIILVLMSLVVSPVVAQQSGDTTWTEEDLSGLKFRSIGPALMSGRIADIAIDPTTRGYRVYLEFPGR